MTNGNNYCICLWILPNKYHLPCLLYFLTIKHLLFLHNYRLYFFRRCKKRVTWTEHWGTEISYFKKIGVFWSRIDFWESKVFIVDVKFIAIWSVLPQFFLNHQAWFLFTTETHFHSFRLQDQTPKWYLGSLGKYLAKGNKIIWWFTPDKS